MTLVYDGAYEAKKYALKQCKSIIDIKIENNRLSLVKNLIFSLSEAN